VEGLGLSGSVKLEWFWESRMGGYGKNLSASCEHDNEIRFPYMKGIDLTS